MQAADDPYSTIKDLISSEIHHITGLQAQLFSGKVSANSCSQQLNASFRDVQEQLVALEAAVKNMVDSPAKFNLDPTTAFMRQVEVETLRFQLDELQRSCSQVETSGSNLQQQQREVEMHSTGRTNGCHSQQQQQHAKSNGHISTWPAAAPSALRHSKLVQQQGNGPRGSSSSSGSSSRPAALHHHPGGAAAAASGPASKGPLSVDGSGWAEFPASHGAADGGDDTRAGWDTYEGAVQQQIMQQQEQALDHISIHVDRIKQQGHLMHDELEGQSLLLDNLQEDTDTSQLRLRGLRRKVQEVIKRSRQDRQLCLILVLSVVLVVLTVVALA